MKNSLKFLQIQKKILTKMYQNLLATLPIARSVIYERVTSNKKSYITF